MRHSGSLRQALRGRLLVALASLLAVTGLGIYVTTRAALVTQFDATLHDPLPRKLHVPFAAIAALAALSAPVIAATVGIILRIRFQCCPRRFLLFTLRIFRPSHSTGST